MIVKPACRRVLLTACGEGRPDLSPLLESGALPGWEVREAGGFGRARFLLQHEEYDALLVDESLARCEGGAGLSWLTARPETPVVLLAAADADLIAEALRAGVHQWLPRDLALRQPRLLAAALDGAARRGESHRGRRAGQAPQDGRSTVGRLVELLWEATPVSGRSRWLTQRHALERLHEEVARAERHGTLLSIALGEVQARPPEGPLTAEELPLSPAIGVRLAAAVRRSDVAGRYGPDGFLLLLPGTPESGAEVCCRRLQGLLERLPARNWFGVACYSAECRTPAALLGCAERRLERARRRSAELAEAPHGVS